jgi:hypothetical protein
VRGAWWGTVGSPQTRARQASPLQTGPWSRRRSTARVARASSEGVRGGTIRVPPRCNSRERPVSRVLCPPWTGGGGHLSWTPVARRLQRPQPEGSAGYLRAPSYLVLLRTGFAWPADHPAAGGLLPHHFTLTGHVGRRCHFCGTFLRVTPTGRYPASCPLEPGLSSPPLLGEMERPPGRLDRVEFYPPPRCGAGRAGPGGATA